MIRDFGIVEPGTTLYIPFHTFDSNDPSASVTLTGLATSDIEIYKDGSVTQRASDAGYTLLDTDGIDFDGITGIHGLSISLADNTTAGFYAAGSQYWVVVSSVTVDAATINFVLCTFRIGYQNARLNTTIATLSSQTSFTLTAGPAEDDALNGFWCLIHDVASAVQCGHALISDYTGSTRTVTLAAGTTFTAAATDNIAIMGPAPMQPTVIGRTLDVSTGGEAGLDWANIGSPTTAVNLSGTNIDVDQVVASVSGAVGSVTGNVGGSVTGSVGSVTGLTNATINAEVDTAIADAALATAANLATVAGYLDTEIAAILADTNELQTDWANGGRLDLILDARASQTSVDDLPTNAELATALGTADDAVLTAIGDLPTNAELATALAAADDAVLAAVAVVDGIVDNLVSGILFGAAATGTLSTTQATTNLSGYADDQLIGRVVIWLSGACEGEASDITDYASSGGLLTFTALTTAPGNGDTFKIV
jgi:hypothetical protein